MTTTRANDPNKIDDTGAWLITHALLVPIGICFFRNIRPYAAFMLALAGEGFPAAGWLSVVAGAVTFGCIQFLEAWPWLLDETAPNSKRMIRGALATIAYSLDILACYTFWPPLVPDAPEGIMLLRYIDWGNVLMGFVTVFGLGLWFYFRKWVRRAV